MMEAGNYPRFPKGIDDQTTTEVDQTVRRALNLTVWNSIRPVTFALAILYGLFALGHVFLLPPDINNLMASLAGGTAVMLFLLAVFIRRIPFSERLTYPLAFVILALTSLNSLLHLFLTGDVLQTTNLILVVFGIGYFILSTPWFLTTLLITLVSWGIFVTQLDHPAHVMHFGIALFSATLVSFIFHLVRKRNLQENERLRLYTEAQREEVEQALQLSEQSQARFKSLSEATFEGIVIHEKGIVLDVNEACAHIFGYLPVEIIGRNMLEFVAQDDRERATNYFLQGYEEPYEIKGLRKDGLSIPVQITARKILHQSKELRVVVIRDLTEIKAAEESRDRFFNLSLDMLCIAGFDGYFKHISPAFERILGYVDQEILAHPFIEFVHQDDQEATQEKIQLLATGSDVFAFENRFQTKDGSYKWLLWNATAFMEAGLIYAIGRDVTKQKENLLALQEREEKLQAILNTTVDGIITTNERGIIQSFNPAAATIFGYQEDEVIGENVHILMPEPYHSAHDGYVSAYMVSREPKIIGKGREVQGIRKNGEIFPLALAVSNVELPGRTLFTGIVRDITERKRAEEALDVARERLQKEIDLAAHIQTSILPRELPELQGFEFAAKALPARYLSGDFYDFIALDQDTCQIVVGDIAGKGVPAALMTLSTKALIKNESTLIRSVPDILEEINKHQYQDLSRAELFVTLILARINNQVGEFWYASAGHGEALLWRNLENEFTEISATGLPIGIFNDESYRSEKLAMRPGDIAIIYSDGVTDAVNPDQEHFGLDRLEALIRDCSTLPADDILDNILESLDDFSLGVDQEDDITIVVVKALPREASFEWPATLESLDQITAKIREQADIYSNDFAYELELACSEVVTNIIEHAFKQKPGNIRLIINLLSDGLQLDFFDDGEAFDISQIPEPDYASPQEGGYGLSIVQQVADEMVYEPHTDRGNHWRLVKYIHGG